jgi:hypothetical protein
MWAPSENTSPNYGADVIQMFDKRNMTITAGKRDSGGEGGIAKGGITEGEIVKEE